MCINGIGPVEVVLFERMGEPSARSLVTRQPDAAGALGQPHDVADGLGDVLDLVLHLHDEAVGELGVGGPGVDEGRAGWRGSRGWRSCRRSGSRPRWGSASLSESPIATRIQKYWGTSRGRPSRPLIM